MILIVDDLEESRSILVRLLEREGYRTRCAQTGVHGLGAVEEYGPELIILDEMMPGMTGLEMLKWLRQAGVKTPVVFFSAVDDREKMEEARRAGATAWLVKGRADWDEVKGWVRQVCGGRGSC